MLQTYSQFNSLDTFNCIIQLTTDQNVKLKKR